MPEKSYYDRLCAFQDEILKIARLPAIFSQWRADHPQFDPTTLPLVQSRTHILAHALKGLMDDVREVLHTLVGLARYDDAYRLFVDRLQNATF